MATDLFLTDTPNDVSATVVEYLLGLTRGDASVSDTATSDNNGTPGATEFINELGNAITWISEPLSAVTISGTITANLRGAESSMNANNQLAIRIGRHSSDGTFIEWLTTGSAPGVELGTSEAAQNWNPTYTSRTLSNGDRLSVQVFATQVGTGASGHTITLWYDGPTASASGDSWVRFAETLTVYVPPSNPPPTRRSPYRQMLAH